jgi:dihydroorotate dehydrogenase (NAD+) catalytic subunit
VSSSRSEPVDLSVQVGSLALPNPIMPASGTAGHSTELAGYVDLGSLGAFVAKSLSDEPWAGNPPVRVHQTPAGMINSVGLQGPGVAAWLRDDLPQLVAAGVQRTVVSLWGRTIEDYAIAASMLADAPPEIVAMEINLSCPNLDGGRHLFAHDPEVAALVVDACAIGGLPRWAKLSPKTHRTVEVAAAVHEAGAEAVTLTNTVMGMVIDVETRRPVLGGGAGGMSGPAIRPVAMKAVYDCYAAHPEIPILGVGGVASARDAVEFMLAGASAVQVGTASFAEPRSTARILDGLARWCQDHGIARVTELIGGAHG